MRRLSAALAGGIGRGRRMLRPPGRRDLAPRAEAGRKRGSDRSTDTGLRPGDQAIDFGDLRRMKPVSRVWGFDRGLPIDRYYIERFLAARSAAIRGRVLEIGEPLYTDMFGGGRITQSEILDVTANPNATYSCPLEEGDDLPDESFDCVILTQTLQYIYDLRGALVTLHRILKRGGTVLCTVPGITRISQEEYKDAWFWSFTGASATHLFSDVFSRDALGVEGFGNILAATGFLYGLAASELASEELDHFDPNYEVIIGVDASK